MQKVLEVFRPEQYEPADWQEVDIATAIYYLPARPYSAQWSEMRCRKTTTGLWLLDRVLDYHERDAANCLIVTTKSGKGTYYDAVPKSLPDGYRLFDVDKDGAWEIIDGLSFPLEGDEFLFELLVPTTRNIVLSHYHCWTNRSLMKSHLKVLKGLDWDFGMIDEAHRIKNKDTQWTKNLKDLTIAYKHVMTGTGFVNNPAELWSILNFLDPKRWRSYWGFARHFCRYALVSGFEKIIGLREDNKAEFIELRKWLG
ncbi:MAG TPA: DEAD/DEAH box helicase, partial [Candidatus Bathyarchaeia archaeon]|nr:DEAD/DEAH box helicase [Candidatus Bathyarchaeia archaeon]